ncbi:response regulator transcription factor [Desulfitobacterium hafniense]|uniref:Stage 0 sporulation protein A homolog n=5 Tax=root TaxID=1 RepID=Q250Z9_DESHY|nr:response regulator transcription factor [Desulfitobacterium hafniense]ACL18355.1 two component transcriptional regulator, winged helix family [Desulfitobacterium hafniense DCB-2]EHL08026.1 putative transcriptional regulatory protein WalR [Desulfitobacterium hafniense DP7]KTE91632.1 two-component system response regulator [Desulfitobacterium hafniense]MEA5025862.1 response regulator transcription factor [Desulfitobacterium hafniense]CDX00346.1 Transcriptional regulatory protein YycF [Desulfi
MKIMLVDDERSIQKAVEYIVRENGYQFCYVDNGLEALEVFAGEAPDLLILDVMLPGLDGFAVCEKIRSFSDVPIIFLSAKGDIVDKGIGFKMGGDDYLVKPFSSMELDFRIKALLRRPHRLEDEPNNSDEVLKIGDLELRLNEYEVYSGGEKVELTAKEFEVLAFLAKNRGQVFTREQLLDRIWGLDFEGDTNTVTVFIRRIREKIEADPAKPQYILTVWGVGYKFKSK